MNSSSPEAADSTRAVPAALAECRRFASAVLPVLHAVQQRRGRVPGGAVPVIARASKQSRAETRGVAAVAVGANVVITTASSDWAANRSEYQVTAVRVISQVTQPSECQRRCSRFNETQLKLLRERGAGTVGAR